MGSGSHYVALGMFQFIPKNLLETFRRPRMFKMLRCPPLSPLVTSFGHGFGQSLLSDKL